MSFDMTLNVKCICCGKDLYGEIQFMKPSRHEIVINIKPCDNCLDAAKDEGYSKANEENQHG